VHPRTIATLAQLEKADWFSKVGVQESDAVIVLLSWEAAIESCGSSKWENLCLEAANQLHERILERSVERFNQWNIIATECRKAVDTLVRGKVKAVVKKHRLPKVFKDTVSWDMIHLCMEAEYAEVFPPAFFASQAYWYVQGHFPCGWKGRFPKGKLVIY